MNGQFLCLLLVQFAGFQAISAIKCYNCTSTTDDNCGITFGYKDGSDGAMAIMVDCEGKYTACRKMVNTDTFKAETYIERSCWTFNNNGSVSDDFYKCDDYSYGKVCYCRGNDDKSPCNGHTRVQPIMTMFLLGLLPFVMLR